MLVFESVCFHKDTKSEQQKGGGGVPEGRCLRVPERWCCRPLLAVTVAVASDSLSPPSALDEGPAGTQKPQRDHPKPDC